MVDAPSTPPKANATVDQKKMFLKSSEGKTVDVVKWVADPKRNQAIDPMTISMSAGSHEPTAPKLCSHLPIFKPTRLSVKPSIKPASATMMKYALFVERCCQRAPPMNKALHAAK